MNLIVNQINGFNIIVEQQIGPFKEDRKEYQTKYNVSISPGRLICRTSNNAVRNLKDIFYLDSWDSIMHYYGDFVHYAENNKVNP